MKSVRSNPILNIFTLFALLASLLGSALTFTPAHATGTCYVNDNAGGTNSGASWTNAYTDLQSAIADSCTEIWVAAGTYKPGTLVTDTFTLKNNVGIYGGFAGTETLRAERDPAVNATTLSGDIGTVDVVGDNSYHVVTGSGTNNTAVLDGFTITRGNATDAGAPYDRGGGIYNSAGSPTLTNLTISANNAIIVGGGMYNFVSHPILTNVTFSGNTASGGGGMYNEGSNQTLTNVTFSGNTASSGGGMYNLGGLPNLTNVTFSNNSGGGMYNGGSGSGFSSPTLKNVIIANNTGGDCVLGGDSTVNASSSNNLIEDAANACGLTDGVNSNIIGTDPALAALADNGGSTKTHALLIGSPAIDAGTNSGAPATDQRGVNRDANVDIGAFESQMQTGPTFTVNTNADTNDSSCDILGQGIGNQDCTLREAINAANTISGADTITFAADYTITLVGSQLPYVHSAIIINGNGAANSIIQASTCNPTAIPSEDCTHSYRVFQVISTGNLTLDGLTVRNGRCSNGSCTSNGYYGGGISNEGALTASNVTFSNNSATWGGGMYNYSSSPTLTNVTFSNNSATSRGGGMYNYNNSNPSLTNVTFSANSATWGGGMSNLDSSPTLTNVTFSANSATVGGGIYNDNGSPTLTNVTFSANSATYYGGGMSNLDSSPTLTNTIIANNIGGDCFNDASTLNASSSNNLIEDAANACGLTNGANGNIIGSDPVLGTLANNGGSTQTFALLTGSPAIDTGTNTGCPATDQRGETRDSLCDIGAYEFEDVVALSVVSITRVHPSPTAKASVKFTVTFSEPVSGVDAADFLLTAPAAIVGESITAVTPVSTSVYTVTVNTGSGNGTLRLDIVGSPSIEDLGMNPLAGPYTGGAAYTINKTLIYRSLGAQDGWMLESTETSNVGGSLDRTATTFNLGDDAADKQYRVLLHFNTSSLPNNAVITRVTLKIRKQGQVGTNPFTTHGGLKVDMRKPFFGPAVGLAIGDFQAAAGKSNVATFNTTPVNNWYRALLNAIGRNEINKTGTTQFRLRFQKDDNNDNGADTMKFFSGDYATASARPTLIIEYYVP